MINYLGQGALHARATRTRTANPFFMLAPDWFRLPLVIIATCATVIASQAVISGAFSVTQQAIHLGYRAAAADRPHQRPCRRARSTSRAINWALMVMVIALVLAFRTSDNLTAAYGIAVTGAMFIDTCLLAVVLFALWKWKPWSRRCRSSLLFFLVDAGYFSANLLKVPSGGWVPLLIGFIAFTFLTTWAKGRQLLARQLKRGEIPPELFIKSATSVGRAGPRHRRVHDQPARRRAPRAAPQSEAQQGAPRALDLPQGGDRGRAARRGGASRSRWRISARASSASSFVSASCRR